MPRRLLKTALATLAVTLLSLPAAAQSLAERNEAMFRQMQDIRGLSNAEITRVRAIFAASPRIAASVSLSRSA